MADANPVIQPAIVQEEREEGERSATADAIVDGLRNATLEDTPAVVVDNPNAMEVDGRPGTPRTQAPVNPSLYVVINHQFCWTLVPLALLL